MKGTVKKVSDMAFTPEYISEGSLNTLETSGCYEVASTVGGTPTANSYFVFHTKYNDSYAMQIAVKVNAVPNVYVRAKTSGSWGNWYSLPLASPSNA